MPWSMLSSVSYISFESHFAYYSYFLCFESCPPISPQFLSYSIPWTLNFSMNSLSLLLLSPLLIQFHPMLIFIHILSDCQHQINLASYMYSIRGVACYWSPINSEIITWVNSIYIYIWYFDFDIKYTGIISLYST